MEAETLSKQANNNNTYTSVKIPSILCIYYEGTNKETSATEADHSISTQYYQIRNAIRVTYSGFHYMDIV